MSRGRQTADRTVRIRDAILGLYQEHVRRGEVPTSNRFIFYEAVQRGIVAKHPGPGAPKREQVRPDLPVQAALTYWREAGVIPWEHIVDETRSLDDYVGFESVADGLATFVRHVRLDPWAPGEPPLILTESRSLAGVLRRVARQYGCRIAATNGQVGGFLHTDIGPVLEPGSRVIYLGDYDISGSLIELNTQERLEEITGGWLEWERLAITREQVDQYGIPPVHKKDRRYTRAAHGGAHLAYETEALQQGVLVQMLTDRLNDLLPVPLIGVLEREKQERERMQASLKRMRRRSRKREAAGDD